MTAFLNAALKVLRIVGRFIIFILLVLLALSNTQEINFQKNKNQKQKGKT